MLQNEAKKTYYKLHCATQWTNEKTRKRAICYVLEIMNRKSFIWFERKMIWTVGCLHATYRFFIFHLENVHSFLFMGSLYQFLRLIGDQNIEKRIHSHLINNYGNLIQFNWNQTLPCFKALAFFFLQANKKCILAFSLKKHLLKLIYLLIHAIFTTANIPLENFKWIVLSDDQNEDKTRKRVSALR